MAKKFFSISKSNKKLRDKTIEQLEHEGLIDSEEVLGGKQDDGKHNSGSGWIKIEKSNQVNPNFQDDNDIPLWMLR
jgi:hypothetical protein